MVRTVTTEWCVGCRLQWVRSDWSQECKPHPEKLGWEGKEGAGSWGQYGNQRQKRWVKE